MSATRISIFGMGYVGCVSGACLASLGHRVIGVEPNPTKIELINAGHSPIVEEGIDELIERAVHKGRYHATNDWRAAVAVTDLALVCVGTPSRANGSIDLGYVRRVCEQIGRALRDRQDFFTVVIRSTVVPGTVEDVVVPILEQESGRRAGEDFGVCMNPEFLREGTSVYDFHHPPKTVIGELNARSGEALRESRIVEVIETMLGKGYDLRIYDRHVSLARLLGANKEYIEKEIPHLSRLMCESIDELVAHSEVLIVSNRNAEFSEVVTRAGADRCVVDLVRIVEPPTVETESYYGICW